MAATLGNEISRRVTRVSFAFEEAAHYVRCSDSNHEHTNLHQDALSDSLERFNLWAGSLGAYHPSSDPRSLEHRLRNAPQVAVRVHELLDSLEGGIVKALEYDFAAASGGADETVPNGPSREEAALLELFDLPDEGGCQILAICDAVADTVGRLIKISMLTGRSVARDRYARAEASAADRFNDSYDVGHVKEKFKHGQEHPWLLERLGKAITKRRQYLKYSREHRSRIAHPNPARLTVGSALGPDSLNIPSSQQEILPTATSVAPTSPSRPSLYPTTASTLRPMEPAEFDIPVEDDRSVSTLATTIVEDDFPNPLRVPDLDTIAAPGMPFDCPFCPTLQTFRSQSSWKRHVFADLRAYLCTFHDCSMVMFEDRKAWAVHEMEKHRRQWFCHLCSWDTTASPSDLVEHLRQSHGDAMDEHEMQLMPSVSSTPMDKIDARQCRLCNWTEILRPANPGIPAHAPILVTQSRFLQHLAHHLEQLALFAIPRETLDDDNDANAERENSGDARRGSQESLLSLEGSIASDAESQKDEEATLRLPETALTHNILHEHERTLPRKDVMTSWAIEDLTQAQPKDTALPVEDWSRSPSDTVLEERCESCEEVGRSCWYCNWCAKLFCDTCWDLQEPHKDQTKGLNDSPHEKVRLSVFQMINSVFQPQFSQEEMEGLQSADAASAWFGVQHDGSGKALLCDYGGFDSLMTSISSTRSPETSLSPNLISVIGETGVGKSTLIKLLIDLNAEKARKYATPITRNTGHEALTTSTDVHVYLGPHESQTEAPILFADCEGSDAGEHELARSRTKPEMRKDRSDGHTQLGNARLKSATKREWQWTSEISSQSLESTLERLITWGSAALMQPSLPSAIVALNGSDHIATEGSWDVDTTTSQCLNTLSRAFQTNVQFRRDAQTRRNRGQRIESLQDLLLCYYSSFRVVHIPVSTRPALVKAQITRLYRTAMGACRAANERKVQLRLKMNAEEMQSYIHMAFDHFTRDLDTPFDFVKTSLRGRPVSQDFRASIVELASLVMTRQKPLGTPNSIFAQLSYLIASSISLDIARNRIDGGNKQQLQLYADQVEDAVRAFREDFWPCEYVNGKGIRCVNVRRAHSIKGHQAASGRILAAGDYQSQGTEADVGEIRLEVIRHLRDIQAKVLTLEEDGFVREDAAAQVHKDFALRNLFGDLTRGRPGILVSRTVCFTCLMNLPDLEHGLQCGHVLCTACLRYLGQVVPGRSVEILECPIGGALCSFREPFRVHLKPASCGIRVLTFDGGGIRGIVQLEILRRLEREFGGSLRIQSFFDLVVGTSTGGIIALGLFTQYWSVEECSTVLVNVCETAFTDPKGKVLGTFSRAEKYRTQPLEDILMLSFGRPTLLLGASYKRQGLAEAKVAVTASVQAGSKSAVLATYDRRSSDSASYLFQRPKELDSELDIWEAARATSAAPGYFKPYRHSKSGMEYLDGGLHHNNPVLVADSERKLIWPEIANDEPDLVVSVGTAFRGKNDAQDDQRRATSSPAYSTLDVIQRQLQHIEDALDPETTWRNYVEAQGNITSDPSRYVRLSLESAKMIPKLDDTTQLRSIQSWARKMVEDDPQYKSLALRLIATCFYFEPARTKQESHTKHIIVTGFIRCRMQASEQLAELGVFLKTKASPSAKHCFVIREDIPEETARRVSLDDQTIDGMMQDREFRMSSSIDIRASRKTSRTDLFLRFANDDQFPISGFPRCLHKA
ncbi:hypothetical protein LTR75_009566 [Friedmanniomyces endolithicus]|nr:hypothetical protein LTR75_009566 [Friedmanniomyces endolithicus]